MFVLIKKAHDADGLEIQHSLLDTGWAFQIHRWEEATGQSHLIDAYDYEGTREREATRSMALGSLDSLHQQALNEIRGDSYTDKRGITWYWAAAMGRYVTIPEND